MADKLEEIYPEQFGIIHSNKSQNYRLQTMASFRESEIRGIVTTDVMARGLDISDISHVINVEFPEIPEQYIHRIGRTGRADKSGIAISLISPREEEIMIEAEVLMEKEIDFIEKLIKAGFIETDIYELDSFDKSIFNSLFQNIKNDEESLPGGVFDQSTT